MDKKAFLSAIRFMRENLLTVILVIVLMLGLTFGEHALSDVLQNADLNTADVCLAVMRLFLQTALSTVLVYIWHRKNGTAAPFSVTDIFKLFVPNLLVTFLLSLLLVGVVTIPLCVWLYLRLDFYMNEFITGRSGGIFSCIRGSFRRTKGYARRFLVYNLKFLLLYFVVELAVTTLTVLGGAVLSESVNKALDVFDLVFLSVLMPYRYLLQCGFYSTYLQETEA